MNGIQGSVSVFVCVGVRSRTHRAELFWKCHKSWFIVCHWSALFEFDNLNHSHSPRRFPSLGLRGLLENKKEVVKGPPQRYQNVRFVLTACAARWGQGLQLFVYVQPDATRKVMSPVGCFLLHAAWLQSEPRWREAAAETGRGTRRTWSQLQRPGVCWELLLVPLCLNITESSLCLCWWM